MAEIPKHPEQRRKYNKFPKNNDMTNWKQIAVSTLILLHRQRCICEVEAFDSTSSSVHRYTNTVYCISILSYFHVNTIFVRVIDSMELHGINYA